MQKYKNIKIQKFNLERKPVGRRKEFGPLVEGNCQASHRRQGQKNQACHPTHALSNTFYTHWQYMSGIGVNSLQFNSNTIFCALKRPNHQGSRRTMLWMLYKNSPKRSLLSRRPSHTPSPQASGPGTPSAQNSPSNSPSHRSLDLGWLQVPNIICGWS